MRAVIADTLGPFENFAVKDIPLPEPGPGEVRVRIASAGVSFVDALTAQGNYQSKPATPFIPGSECAGIVDRIGEGTHGIAPGERVCVRAPGGAFAEFVCAPPRDVFRLPAGMDLAEGAVIRVAYSTALHALSQRGRLQQGERLLVLGAGGALGQAAVQLGKALGAFVIGGASSPEKRMAAAEAGADATIDSAPDRLRAEIAAVTNGQPLDVVFDPVGGSASEAAFRSLGWDGRHLVVGFASGTIPPLPTNLPLLKGASLIGVNVGRYNGRKPDGAAINLERIFTLYNEGRITPRIAHRFPLPDFAIAMRMALEGRATGRIILGIAALEPG
jgi:NADPH2:quinone reductase